MQTLPPVPSVIKLRIPFFNSVLTGETITHWRYVSPPPTEAALASFCEAAVTNWAGNFPSHSPTTVHWGPCFAQDLSAVDANQATGTTTSSGTNVSDALPVNVAVLVNHIVKRRYRGGKPRNYLPIGVEEDITTGEAWTTAALTSFQTGWNGFVLATKGFAGGISVSGLVNVSYYHGFTVVVDPVTERARNVPTLRTTPQVDDITSSVVNPIPGTQRRRIRRG